MQVFKFGGASVKDAESVINISTILLKSATEPTIVVVSAMGKITNELEQLVNAYYFKEGNISFILEKVKNFHLKILNQLFTDKNNSIFNEIENIFVELLWELETEPSFTFDHHYDQIVSQGEILSTKIISAFLNEIKIFNKFIDARDFIKTDNTFREAKVDYQLTEKLVYSQLLPILESNKILITQGFIGSTSENFTTTLGREGSDFSAALFAFFTNSERVVFWKDVAGVLNADPKYFKNTKKIDELSYHDAIELTYFGTSVIHPKTIKPLQNKNIPLFVKSFINPEQPGTVIKKSNLRNPVTSYIFKTNQILLSIQPKDYSFIVEENLSLIFSLFSKHLTRINMMQNSAISFSVCIDNDKNKIKFLLKDLQEQFKVLFNEDVELMTIRNYDQETITSLSKNKIILIEQRSRNTYQMVMKDNI